MKTAMWFEAQWASRLVAVALLPLASAEIYRYKLDLGAYGSLDNLRFRQSGMFASIDAPSNTPPGEGHSYIDFGDLEFEVAPGSLTMAYPGAVTFVEIAAFESKHFNEIGIDVGGPFQRQYCCTPWVANRTGCHPARGLITQLDHPGDKSAKANASIMVMRVPVKRVTSLPPRLLKAAPHARVLREALRARNTPATFDFIITPSTRRPPRRHCAVFVFVAERIIACSPLPLVAVAVAVAVSTCRCAGSLDTGAPGAAPGRGLRPGRGAL